MLIVIEGPDGSGKSTLNNRLYLDGIVKKALDSPRLAAKGNPERMVNETYRYLRLYSPGPEKYSVDRFLFSEMVYGKIIRGHTAFSQPEYLQILVNLMEHGSVIIFCTPPTLTFKPDESKFLIGRMDELKQGYEEIYKKVSEHYSGCINYDYTLPLAYSRLTKTIERSVRR